MQSSEFKPSQKNNLELKLTSIYRILNRNSISIYCFYLKKKSRFIRFTSIYVIARLCSHLSNKKACHGHIFNPSFSLNYSSHIDRKLIDMEAMVGMTQSNHLNSFKPPKHHGY